MTLEQLKAQAAETLKATARGGFQIGERVAFDVTGLSGEVLERLEGRIVKLFKNGKAQVLTGNLYASKVYNVSTRNLTRLES